MEILFDRDAHVHLPYFVLLKDNNYMEGKSAFTMLLRCPLFGSFGDERLAASRLGSEDLKY